MAIPVTLIWPGVDPSFIASLQSNGAASLLNLKNTVIKNFGRTITLTSAFNNSGVNFTITGTDIYGAPATTTLAGPNANTVETSQDFHTITSIAASGGFTAVTAGIGTGGVSIWVVINPLCIQSQTSLNVHLIGGAVTYTILRTAIDFNQYPFPPSVSIYSFQIDPSLTDATTSQAFEMTIPSTGVQLVMERNPGVNIGSLAFTVLQQGIK